MESQTKYENLIYEKLGPIAVVTINRPPANSWSLAAMELEGSIAVKQSEDAVEGFTAFFEKREPVFKGK